MKLTEVLNSNSPEWMSMGLKYHTAKQIGTGTDDSDVVLALQEFEIWLLHQGFYMSFFDTAMSESQCRIYYRSDAEVRVWSGEYDVLYSFNNKVRPVPQNIDDFPKSLR